MNNQVVAEADLLLAVGAAPKGDASHIHPAPE
jgi:hypothetical protein